MWRSDAPPLVSVMLPGFEIAGCDYRAVRQFESFTHLHASSQDFFKR